MANENLVCPICGQATRVYMGNARKDRLCGKHADELKAGNIVLGEDGLFYDVKSKKVLNKGAEKKEQPKVASDSSELTCLLCGDPSNGKHFCLSCYKKYKSHCIVVSIKECRDVEIIEKYAEGMIYVCKDGHQVRSKSEMVIDDYLYDHEIRHCYEYLFDVDGTTEIKPDFYLPEADVYLEHFGITNSERYEKEKQYKLDIYRKAGVTVICTDEDDMKRPDFCIARKLKHYEAGKVNFDT